MKSGRIYSVSLSSLNVKYQEIICVLYIGLILIIFYQKTIFKTFNLNDSSLSLDYNILFSMDYDARKDSLLSQQESEKMQIYISCKNTYAQIANAQVFLQQANKPKKNVYYSKPTHSFDSKLQFADCLVIQYFFQVRQKLTIVIHDSSVTPKKIVGSADATVGQIFNGRDKGIIKDLILNGNKTGTLHLRCEKVERGSVKYVQFNLNARNIDVGSKFFCFGTGEGQWKLYKKKNNQQYLLYESECRPGSNNRYNHFKINQKRLCNNNPQQPIILRFFNQTGTTLIGQTNFDLETLQSGKHRHTLTKSGSQKGVIFLQNFKQTVKYQFTDYLRSGLQMAMVCCIDFTGSNGIQTQPTSLHYYNQNKRSQYEEALHEVCNIVLDYDNDKLVPTYGFGAKVNMPNFNTQNKVHHCFPINGTPQNPNLFKTEGIIQYYRKCMPFLQLSGPTLFSPLIREAMTVSQRMKQSGSEYMILLILTDGVIHDKEQVKDLLVKCSRLPLSLIIIGIGNNDDWSAMHQLDDDNCVMVDFQGNKSERDLVQFVQFSQHNNNGVELAREVLQQLPRQVEQYHQLVGITPEYYMKNINNNDIFIQMSNNIPKK